MSIGGGGLGSVIPAKYASGPRRAPMGSTGAAFLVTVGFLGTLKSTSWIFRQLFQILKNFLCVQLCVLKSSYRP